jgi:hypothetical protein
MRALAASVGIGAHKPAGVEARLGKRALAFCETLLGLREAEDDAILGRDRWRARACCFRARRRLTISLKAGLGYFFRKASIDTTLA